MTLVVTLFVREGIVLASDSRMSLRIFEPSTTVIPGVTFAETFSYTQTDSIYKTYLVAGRVGISLYGGADVDGVPISGFMDTFARQREKDTGTVEQLAQAVKEEFRTKLKVITTGFHIAGYDSRGGIDTQHVYRLPIQSDELTQMNVEPKFGAIWDGEVDILDRLLKPATVNDAGKGTHVENHEVRFNWFTLHDAVEFAKYAIRVTAQTMFYQPRRSTVGGPVDLLVLKPDGPEWLQRKTIRAPIQ
jgi:hypothetical protein